MINHPTLGFTLLELLIVVVILGVFVVLVAPSPFIKDTISQHDSAKTQIRMLEQALDAHRLDTLDYPSTLEGLLKNTVNKVNWNGPYLLKVQEIPTDPWGRAYHYRKPGRDGREYDLFSFGADGQEGGEYENADVVSWEFDAKRK